MGKKRLATIIDVAKSSGVSAATVSRVLHGTAVVSPDTEKRIRAVIKDLNYAPRPAARQLVSQRTNTIGLLLPEISGAFFSPMLKGIEAGVRDTGFDLLIHSTHSDSNGEVPRQASRRALGEHNTDGLIVFPGSIDQAEMRRLHSVGFPVVLLHQAAPDGTNFPMVTVENKSGTLHLINHLIEVHHRQRIVFLKGLAGHEDSEWRERGYRESLEAHHIPWRPDLIGYGGFCEEGAYQTMLKLIEAGVQFDAVFSGDDDSAAGVLSALRQAGRPVPEEVSVVGFDDMPFSRYLSPPLTTVRAPIEKVGLKAVQLLVACIQEKQYQAEVLFPTELVIRQSCGCL
jgi:LacI family transcriptional regulator